MLSPVWMQVEHKRPGPDPMKPFCDLNAKKEANRTFLVAKQQPRRNVLGMLNLRHDVHSKEAADRALQFAIDKGHVSVDKPDRFIEWKEERHKQKYDRVDVSPKIGSAHFK